MEQFIVSALKYRPDNFASIIGQDNIVTTLQNSIIRGQLAHAYLFCGPRGVGKTTMARIFAKSINCLNPGKDMEPCGVCESCLSFSEGRSYCIHELDAASNNSVDDIRNLTEMVRIPPQIGKYSVYIIDEVHMLSASAFNAFLKTLEEPPGHAIFILATTEKHKILPTILSRCQTYDFNRISIPDIVKNLSKIAEKEGISIDTESTHVIAVKGDGSMRDALTLFDQAVAFCGKEIKYKDVIKNLNVLDYDYYFKIVENSLMGDYISSLLLFDEILSKGFNALYFISGLSSHLRDLIVCRHSAGDALLSLPPTLIKRYKKQSSDCTLEFLYNALNVTTTCEAGYRASGNQRLHIEFALMKLAENAFKSNKDISKTKDLISANQSQESLFRQNTPITASTSSQHVVQALSTQQTAAPAPVESGSKVSQIKSQENSNIAPDIPQFNTGISLKQMIKQEQENEFKQKEADYNFSNGILTEEKIKEAWVQTAEIEKKMGRKSLGAALTLNKLNISLVTNTITCYVSNIVQRDWIIEKALTEIEKNLRDILKNNKMKVEIEVAESSKSKKRLPYTVTDKAKFILANNEEIRQLQKDLDLDIK